VPGIRTQKIKKNMKWGSTRVSNKGRKNFTKATCYAQRSLARKGVNKMANYESGFAELGGVRKKNMGSSWSALQNLFCVGLKARKKSKKESRKRRKRGKKGMDWG